MRGTNALSRARETELLQLAAELTVAWNPVRTFGTGAGTISFPEGAKEMLRWEHRALSTIETWFQDRDFSYLKKGGSGGPTIADIVLFQFLEFTDDCYGVDMTKGSGEKVTDVYGREAVQKYDKLTEFYQALKGRDSVTRDEKAGEVASQAVLERMQMWAEGVL
jgi:glutathione S-transferase